MAAAAYASLVSLITVIDQIQDHPSPPITLDEAQVESLTNNITFLRDFLEAYPHDVINEAADRLESRILEAARAAEDVIESHVVDQILGESTSHALEKIKVTCRCLTETVDNFYRSLQKVVRSFEFLKKEVMEIRERMTMIQDVQTATQTMHAGSVGYPSQGHKTYVVGFDDVLNEVLDKLTRQQSSRQILPIVGMGGIGKTTLARNIYRNQQVVDHFDKCFWVTISQAYNVLEILLQILSNEEIEESGEGLSQKSEEELGETLHKKLFGRRYLVIMDDMWSIEVWNKINCFFPDNNNGSRIMITTRISNMASLLTDSHIIKLNLLDINQSWELIWKNVFGEEAYPYELEEVGKKIAKNCKGLPLSMAVISGLLAKSTGTQEHWENIAQNLKSVLTLENDEACIKILYMSYSHLPIHLKPCFLYMGLFPEDSEIEASKLIKLWIAEGFLKPICGKSLEVVAQEYLKDLVSRNLILVKSSGFDGKIKSFQIHDLLLEVCLSEAKKEKFLRFSQRHISGVQYWTNAQHCIMQSVNLRFISHPATYLSPVTPIKLPPWIHLSWNLQTLIIKGAKVDVTNHIWRMYQLRHMKVGELHLGDPPGQKFGLWKLQSMSRTFNLRLSDEVVRGIPNVRRLKCLYTNYRPGYCFKNFIHLQNLESLTLNMRYQRELPNLNRNLCLNFNLPHSLKKLSLGGTSLCWEDVTTKLGSLPLLQVLKLNSFAVAGHEWKLTEDKFCSLRILEILDNYELQYWVAESIHFPCLEHIILEGLLTLEEIPSGIGEIPTLQSIKLQHCTNSAVASAEEILKEQEEFGNFDLKITIMDTLIW